jgi:hypothetical protein
MQNKTKYKSIIGLSNWKTIMNGSVVVGGNIGNTVQYIKRIYSTRNAILGGNWPTIPSQVENSTAMNGEYIMEKRGR